MDMTNGSATKLPKEKQEYRRAEKNLHSMLICTIGHGKKNDQVASNYS